MYKLTKLLIFFNIITFITTSYVKKNVDKSNVLSKGVWFKNKDHKGPNFIFPTNLDSVLQNNFDVFEENNVQSPFSSNYIDRNKRSPSYESISSRNRHECKDKSKCQKQNSLSQKHFKFISTVNPLSASVFNDYPYEVAALLNHNDNSLNSLNHINNPEKDVNIVKMVEVKPDDRNVNIKDLRKDLYLKSGLEKEIKFESSSIPPNVLSKHDNTNANKTVTVPKRSRNQQDFENELLKKIELVEELNDTESYKSKKDINTLEKNDIGWLKLVPPSNVNIYKVIPKPKEDDRKRINERGLIKVLSLLTKTFKKIMKQHNEIKQIHNKLYNLNDDFVKNVDLLTKKFEDFNKRYSEIMKLSTNLKRMEVKLKDKELNYDKREKDFSKQLTKFENQQQTFLAQQHQFYNVQKALLQQNEQIGIKQNVITKTQSEISHRQNNFARILKKAKQIYLDSKHSGTSISKSKQPIKNTKVVPTPFTTESVKINLFSIPTISQLKDQDQSILGEKDSQTIDDLIYKYYFNNTLIDDIMRNKILASFIASERTMNNKTKPKRDEKDLNTILLPVNGSTSKIRNRRWIKNSKKNRKLETKQKEILNSKMNGDLINNNKTDSKIRNDPFQNMALNFCKEIGQNVSTQIFKWCIEKILRRLKVIDLKMPPPIQMNAVQKQEVGKSTLPSQFFGLTTSKTLNEKADTSTSSAITEQTTSNVFFPDNDDLENKLKEYELTPDPEGTVYYDGSLHSSDLGHIFKADSEGFSDIIPGLDSDSRIQVDPFAIDLQEKRRAEVRKINAKIMNMKMG